MIKKKLGGQNLRPSRATATLPIWVPACWEMWLPSACEASSLPGDYGAASPVCLGEGPSMSLLFHVDAYRAFSVMNCRSSGRAARAKIARGRGTFGSCTLLMPMPFFAAWCRDSTTC